MKGNGKTQRQILIVAGMHRSGTSLLARLLREAGISMGARLMPAHKDNPQGYFENLDFVELHGKILSYHRTPPEGWTLEANLPVPDHLRQEALAAVARNEQAQPWGWKDPRTTLFLDFWASELPEARFVFVHRPPWEVIDSLYRRGDGIFQMDPSLALHVWEHYNRLVFDFATKNPARSLLVGVHSLAHNWQECVRLVAEHLSVPVSPPQEFVVERGLLKRGITDSHWAKLLMEYFPEAQGLWRDLEQLSPPPLRSTTGDGELIAYGLGEIMLRDWMLWRKAEVDSSRKTEILEEALYNVRSDLYHANARLQYVERSRIWKLRNRLQGIRTLLR